MQGVCRIRSVAVDCGSISSITMMTIISECGADASVL
jgi:hypothetical protein